MNPDQRVAVEIEPELSWNKRGWYTYLFFDRQTGVQPQLVNNFISKKVRL